MDQRCFEVGQEEQDLRAEQPLHTYGPFVRANGKLYNLQLADRTVKFSKPLSDLSDSSPDCR